jgi:hypothetical protein
MSELQETQVDYHDWDGKKHNHSAINSPDEGETCGVCGANFRNTERHLLVGE